MQTQKQEIRSLTGLRGVAACFVVFYHLSLTGFITGGIARHIVEHGYISVDLFFLLSGFVMALSYERLFLSTPLPRAYPTFLLRRVARIYPLYLVVLLFTAAQDIRHALQHHVSLVGYGSEFVANLFFFHGLGLAARIVGSSWSVGAEFAAYLLLPALLLVTTKKLSAGISATVAYVALILIMYPPFRVDPGISGPLDISAAYSILPVIRCVAEFSIGLCLFRFANSIKNAFESNLASAGLLILMVVALDIPSSDAFLVALSTLFIASLLNTNMTAAAFAWRPIFFLGQISYALYLWHRILFGTYEPILRRLVPHIGETAGRYGALLGFWAVLIGVSYASYRLVEVPGRRFVRNIERRLFPAEDAALRRQEEDASKGLTVRARAGE